MLKQHTHKAKASYVDSESTSNLVRISFVGNVVRDNVSRALGQVHRKQKYRENDVAGIEMVHCKSILSSSLLLVFIYQYTGK